MQKHAHHLFLVWLIITGLISLLLILAWHHNILSLLFYTDQSKISIVIALLYFCVTIHCAMRTFYISSEINHAQKITSLFTMQQNPCLSIENDKVKINGEDCLPNCLVTDYIHDLLGKTDAKPHNHEKNNEKNNINSDHIEYYRSKLKSPHDMGWFVADLMLKMGLLGTIIGFILMLGSVSNISDFDITTMQQILKHMSSGMGTALYTTLAGLVCSICSAIQYQILDHESNNLIDSISYLTQVHI